MSTDNVEVNAKPSQELNVVSHRKGCDPLLSTARGKLQKKRSKLNDEINRELRMRNGAENLFRATDNKRLKELVSVELLFFNSNIQLLKEEVSDLNSSVNVYQHDNSTVVPMIPLGLKETKDIDYRLAIKDFILEHYSEAADSYNSELQDLQELRLALRTPQRNDSGVELLMEYYNQLYFLEKRFFPADRKIPIMFHWYDSLTGVPNIQKTLTFEKGCVMFNIGALFTQIACKQDRLTKSGLSQAIKYFELAGGAFRYLHNHFSHAPSMDMQPQTLTMLVQLMMSQAQECVYESLTLHGVSQGILQYSYAAQEASMVSQMYRDTQQLMSTEQVKDYIPYSWLSMAQVKAEYYNALANHLISDALLDQPDSINADRVREMVQCLSNQEEGEDDMPVKVPQTFEERKQLAKALLKEALMCHEEALRLHNMCKQLRKVDTFLTILKRAHDQSVSKFSTLEEEDDFTEIHVAPKIKAISQQLVAPVTPEFSKVKVQEIFKKLGPIAVFNSKNYWTAPRTVALHRPSDQGYGFSVRGDCPVKVADIEPGSVAERGNINVGDYIVAVGGSDTKWAKHDEVVNLVRKSGSQLVLRLITPMNQDCLEPSPASAPSTPRTPMRMVISSSSLSASSNKSSKSRLSAPWIFAKKGSKDKDEQAEEFILVGQDADKFSDHDILM
ncbi:rhophilin-2-B-like [Mercenaria mercenaria]|uniref:rhophilin-2-B-like n=1 Tax=Mercenaria mercenaria TaxID=6596 RepID=UPI001E1D9101|nr:rhophilin-2-B-like [Mercenaria mercenaria]